MKQYLGDVRTIPSEVMQCQMLFEKVNEKESSAGLKHPTVLSALLAAAVLEKLEKVLKNYGAVFSPLRKLILRLIFSNPPSSESEAAASSFVPVPYFSITAYFASKVTSRDMLFNR